ncbi:hypothetical protein [Mycolicibacterium frederiksbergense]|uniref:hypothetical protein n=1 Tax=Mycolicibacterium frederiksbergense TaxID=117567 RepID=UPI00265C7C3D|nr:hypothetical protein [Mycolicibacterium frederiksbergense]MDO0978136.1 hypothetical protein [Mycolicibacterium frederiksbergense]
MDDTGRDRTSEEKELLELSLGHAWDWFSLHAAQRMQMINFYVLSIAFVTAAYVASIANNRPEVAVGTAIICLVFSAIFWRLEVRTRELVRIARNALFKVQGELAALTGFDTINMAVAAETSVSNTGSYATLITRLYAAVGAVYLIGGIYAIVLSACGTK